MELRNNQFVQGQLKATDSKGDDAPLKQGSTEATTDNSEVATVEIDPEDTTKLKVIGQRAGATVLRGKVTAEDLNGDGEAAELPFEVAIQVTSGEASSLAVTFGEAQDQ